jgi:hypothetical protein
VYAGLWHPGDGRAVSFQVAGAFYDTLLFLIALAALAAIISLVRGRPGMLTAGAEQELL